MVSTVLQQMREQAADSQGYLETYLNVVNMSWGYILKDLDGKKLRSSSGHKTFDDAVSAGQDAMQDYGIQKAFWVKGA